MVHFPEARASVMEARMHSTADKGFLRISNRLFDALLCARLCGAQWRVLLWVIRYTCGWNRVATSFTWYGIAKDLGLDRAAVYRAGQALVHTGVLVQEEGRLGIEMDSENWAADVRCATARHARQLTWPEIDVAGEHRQTLPGGNAGVVTRHRKRCQDTTVFRRPKDSSKDNLKTNKDRGGADGACHLRRTTNSAQPPLLTGAAGPIPGKYDRLSQNRPV
jgi:phage replication O-like protein O